MLQIKVFFLRFSYFIVLVDVSQKAVNKAVFVNYF